MKKLVPPKVSIVIVNWNTKELVRDCLQSIKRYKRDLPVEVFVIDNDSSDGSEEFLKKSFKGEPWLTLIQSGENLGFGKGCNVGIKRARGEYVFILNPDTQIFENTLQALVSYTDKYEDVAVVAPKLVNPDGSLQESIRRFPTVNDQALILLKLHHFFKNLEPVERYLATDFSYDEEADVEQPMGAALFFRRDVLKKQEGFDEQFFLWFEEVDLLKRIHDTKKWKIRYTPSAKVMHVKGQAFGQLKAMREQHILNTSMLKYFAKQRPGEEYLILLLLMPFSYLLAFGVQILEWLNLLPKNKAEQTKEGEKNA